MYLKECGMVYHRRDSIDSTDIHLAAKRVEYSDTDGLFMDVLDTAAHGYRESPDLEGDEEYTMSQSYTETENTTVHTQARPRENARQSEEDVVVTLSAIKSKPKEKHREVHVVRQAEGISDVEPPPAKAAARCTSGTLPNGPSDNSEHFLPSQTNRDIQNGISLDDQLYDLYGDDAATADNVEDVLQQHRSRREPITKKRQTTEEVALSPRSLSDRERSPSRGRKRSQTDSHSRSRSRTDRRRQSRSASRMRKRRNTRTSGNTRRKRGRERSESSGREGRRRNRGGDARRRRKRDADDDRNEKGNPRLMGYYSDTSRDFITKAKNEFRCTISLTTPFPTPTEQATIARASFKAVKGPGKKTPTPDQLFLVKNESWIFRGVLKGMAKTVVEDGYNFIPPADYLDNLKTDRKRDPNKTLWVAAVSKFEKDKANRLLTDAMFTRGVRVIQFPRRDPICGTPYFHEAIANLIHAVWFTKRNSLAPSHKEKFSIMPVTLIALSCCTIKNILDCYALGADVKFKAETYRPDYDFYYSNLVGFSNDPIDGPHLSRWRRKIYETGWSFSKSVGVSISAPNQYGAAPWVPSTRPNTNLAPGRDREPQPSNTQVETAGSIAHRSSHMYDYSPDNNDISRQRPRSDLPAPSRHDTMGNFHDDRRPSPPPRTMYRNAETLSYERRRTPPRTQSQHVTSRMEYEDRAPPTRHNATAGPSASRRSPAPHYDQDADNADNSVQQGDRWAPSWGRSYDARDGEWHR
ncbi:hypothetical protein BD410DRAFT_809597 [Rickenella mellea]|uniref:DUF6532 domain-containing protein n=1 Tax=Rickenella mellea TaxID=50990 RepID=A0A4Y7PIF5_9AGAM|nr:hypothetical protein BD410DRAFT_809597 [Rickenella mellea]